MLRDVRLEGLDRNRERVERVRTRLARWMLPASGPQAPAAPSLEARHVEGCRVVQDREALIRDHLPKRAIVAEVGTFRGANAQRILEGADPKELHLIDRDFSILERGPLEAAIEGGRVHLHEGDSSATLAGLPAEQFDWIYIDADNSYRAVKQDIEAAKSRVKSDGLLVFHNYMFFSHNELKPYGFVPAVHELCVAEDWAMRYLALHPRMYCDVAVSRLTD